MQEHDQQESSHEWGEVIMGNSPFAEYLKELKSNSNIDVDPISSYQILPPPTPEPQLPITTDHPAHSPSFSPSKPLKDPKSMQQLVASMYRKMYHYVVGSELLHPEESIFLCDEENTEDFKLKPEVETLEDFDLLSYWLSMRSQVFIKLRHMHKRIGVLVVPLVAAFYVLQHSTLGLVISLLVCTTGFLAVGIGYYFFVQYVITMQHQIEREMQEAIEHSKRHDINLLKVMKTIQEVELIARGYRLSTPLSPIERLEQSAKSKKSLHMRIKAEDSISQSRRILRENSLRFLGFLSPELSRPYCTSITVDQPEKEEPAGELALAGLKAAYYQHFIERSRFFSLVLLSFYNVTHRPGTFSIWRQYKSIIGWQKETDQVVSRWLLRLQTDVVELKTCISTEFWANQIPQRVMLNKTQRTVHERFFQQSKDLKLLLQGIIARVALCEENIHKTNTDGKEESDTEGTSALSELVEQYQIVRRDLAQSLELWDSGNILLLRLIDSLSKDPNDAHFKQLRSLAKDGPSTEVSEELVTPVTLELMRDEENENQEEQLFEADTGPLLTENDSEEEKEEPPKPPPPVSFVPGVPPPPPPMGLKFVSKKKPKKSRAERLAEKEEKRMTMTAILPELEAKNVINELKDVLKIRRPPKEPT